MDARQLVEMALAYKGISNTELAKRIGWSPQQLHQRLNTGKFTLAEWAAIGEAIGAEAAMVFRFADGKTIE